MKYIWTYVHSKNWTQQKRTFCFLLLTTLLSCAIGFAIWFLLHFFVLNKISWAICFIGYPGYFIGLLGGIYYLYRHNI